MDANLVVISKYDLCEAVEFNEEEYLKDIKNINSKVKIIKSSKKGEGFEEIVKFIEHKREHLIEKEHKH